MSFVSSLSLDKSIKFCRLGKSLTTFLIARNASNVLNIISTTADTINAACIYWFDWNYRPSWNVYRKLNYIYRNSAMVCENGI